MKERYYPKFLQNTNKTWRNWETFSSTENDAMVTSGLKLMLFRFAKILLIHPSRCPHTPWSTVSQYIDLKAFKFLLFEGWALMKPHNFVLAIWATFQILKGGQLFRRPSTLLSAMIPTSPFPFSYSIFSYSLYSTPQQCWNLSYCSISNPCCTIDPYLPLSLETY